MKTYLTVIGIASVLSLFCSTAVVAGPWSVPNNVRVVQKSNTDNNGRIYVSIQGAIDSISDATEANPYVVKVMPGIYEEAVTMKPYVDVVGSSREYSVITSTVRNADFDTCSAGTVVMASNSALRNVKIVNTAVDGGNENLIAGIVFNNVQAAAEQVNILVGDGETRRARNNGICVAGASGHAILNDVNIDVHNVEGSSNAVLALYDGNMTIANSRLNASTANEFVQVVDCVQGSTYAGVVTITNSRIEGSVEPHESGEGTALYVTDCKASIAHSLMKASAGASSVGVAASNGDLSIMNSQIYSDGVGIIFTTNGVTKARIATSLVKGGFDDLTNVLLINNFDEDMNPVPNQ